jgi:DNA polymerase-3 subunit gamma/tau
MSYEAIARKWRPQSFKDLVGQDHISQTLLNALRNQRLHHALLFTGPRGTGKTSTARILAKSLRCPNAVDFVPCHVCTSCLEVAQSRSIDVVEIDGASNNGVDAIRDLRDSVSYRPASGQYKVYIIDEVHMLSTSAFNALLKTLEEPPSHVIFMMATTEVHKIPATILSRVQRFDFRRIPVRQIVQRLKEICEKDQKPSDEQALWLIARQGDGSMRDSQSLLDQVITFANGPLTSENVTSILGLTDRALLYKTLNALIDRQPQNIIALLSDLQKTGIEATLFSRELLEMLRHLMMVKVSAADVGLLVDLPETELNALAEMSARTSEEELQILFDMALKAAADIQKSQDALLVLEMTLLRMATAPNLVSLKTLLNSGALPVLDQRPLTSPSLAPKTPPTPAASLGFVDLKLKPEERWMAFVERVRSSEALFAAKIENLLFIKEESKILHLGIPSKLAFLKEQMGQAEGRQKMQGLIDSFWGTGYSFDVQTVKEVGQSESAQTMTEKKQLVAHEELKKSLNEHPMVKAAQTVFKGQIKTIERGKP